MPACRSTTVGQCRPAEGLRKPATDISNSLFLTVQCFQALICWLRIMVRRTTRTVSIIRKSRNGVYGIEHYESLANCTQKTRMNL